MQYTADFFTPSIIIIYNAEIINLVYVNTRGVNRQLWDAARADSCVSLRNNYTQVIILSLAQAASLSCAAHANSSIMCSHL